MSADLLAPPVRMGGVRARIVLVILIQAACAALLAGCGSTSHRPAARRGTPVGQATCLGGPGPPRIGPGTLGVYRAGPLTMALYRDLAQIPMAQLGQAGEGVGASVTITGHRPAILSVDPASRRRLGLQFTPMSGYGPGLSAVRFPPCPGHTPVSGGVVFHAAGCVRLHVTVPGAPARPLLIALDNSLAGCPHPAPPARLPGAAFPYLGIACRIANWARCDRIRVGVHLRRPATLVTVAIDGRLVTLSPPADPGDDLWQGALLGAGPAHGPLAVRSRDGYWYGEPPVHPRLRVTAYFPDGRWATRAGLGDLHPGYG